MAKFVYFSKTGRVQNMYKSSYIFTVKGHTYVSIIYDTAT